MILDTIKEISKVFCLAGIISVGTVVPFTPVLFYSFTGLISNEWNPIKQIEYHKLDWKFYKYANIDGHFGANLKERTVAWNRIGLKEAPTHPTLEQLRQYVKSSENQ